MVKGLELYYLPLFRADFFAETKCIIDKLNFNDIATHVFTA